MLVVGRCAWRGTCAHGRQHRLGSGPSSSRVASHKGRGGRRRRRPPTDGALRDPRWRNHRLLRWLRVAPVPGHEQQEWAAAHRPRLLEHSTRSRIYRRRSPRDRALPDRLHALWTRRSLPPRNAGGALRRHGAAGRADRASGMRARGQLHRALWRGLCRAVGRYGAAVTTGSAHEQRLDTRWRRRQRHRSQGERPQ